MFGSLLLFLFSSCGFFLPFFFQFFLSFFPGSDGWAHERAFITSVEFMDD